MFTGIVERTGNVLEKKEHGDGFLFFIEIQGLEKTVIGSSIAINGVCLTVRSIEGSRYEFEVMAESVKKITLGGLEVGSMVNVETSLKMGEEIAGHFVYGHVDEVGAVSQVAENVYRILVSRAFMKYVVPQGSVAVDGISLTVSNLGEDWFEVSLIGHTLQHTTFSVIGAGDHVNLEADMLAKYVEKIKTL